MEPFTVTCSTCESRIRVRNPNMVGQLANCPKCGSMLMISPAEAATATPGRSGGQARIEVEGRNAAPVDSMAVTKEGLATDINNFATGVEQTADPEPALDGAPPRDATAADDDEYRLAELADGEALDVPPIQSHSLHSEAWQSEATPHVPSEQWTSDSTNRTRQYLLVGFLGLSGFVLSAILFWGFLRWHASDGSDNPPADAGQPATVDPTSLEPALPQPNLDAADLATALPNNASDVAQIAPSIEPAPLDANPSLAPERPSNEPAATAPLPDTDSQSPAATQPLPKQLAAFAPILGVEIQPQFPDAMEIRSEAPVTAEDLGLTSTAGLPEIPATNLAAQSQIKISGLVIAPLPLAQFVSLWSNISGVPTVVDLESLSAAAIDRNQKLSLGLVQSASVGSLIPQLGHDLGLAAEPRDNRYLELVAPAELIEEKLPSAVPLAGLISEPSGEEWLLGALRELFPEQEIPWLIEAGQLPRPQLADGSPLDAKLWFSAVKLIEGWRLASVGESSLSQYTVAQLSAELIQPADVAGLTAVLHEVTPQSRPVAQVLPRMCQQVGVQAWIDWANVGTVGLGPESTAMFITASRPLQRVLADYASEFSLVVAVLDKQSLWITSNQAYRSSPQRYVLPSAGRSAEEWKSQLRPLTPAASEGVGSVVVIPTPDEQFMLVRCCRPMVSF